MPQTPADLFAALDRLRIPYRTVHHAPLFTVEQSRSLRGEIPGGHTKNLFLRDKKGAIFLVVAEEDAEIDLKGLHRLLGASGRFSFGSADLLREVWGVESGSVSPFGAINDTGHRVTVVLDADNTMTTSIARDDLIRFLRSTGHEPRIELVSAPAEDETARARLHSPDG